MTRESPESWAKRELEILGATVGGCLIAARGREVKIPRRFAHCSGGIKAVGWVSERNKPAVDACIAFSKNPSTAQAPFLMGPSGAGKTHLFWATAADIMASHAIGLDKWSADALEVGADQIGRGDRPDTAPPMKMVVEATNGAEIAHELRMSVKTDSVDAAVNSFRQIDLPRGPFGPPRLGECREPLPKCKVLLIDDIEIMKIGDWLAEELYRIVDYRYAENMPTMYVSNLSPEELRNHIGDRIARRMLDMTKPIVMK